MCVSTRGGGGGVLTLAVWQLPSLSLSTPLTKSPSTYAPAHTRAPVRAGALDRKVELAGGHARRRLTHRQLQRNALAALYALRVFVATAHTAWGRAHAKLCVHSLGVSGSHTHNDGRQPGHRHPYFSHAHWKIRRTARLWSWTAPSPALQHIPESGAMQSKGTSDGATAPRRGT